MNTVEILIGIKESILRDPALINEIKYNDIYNMVYLDIQCRRQLYPAHQIREVEVFFERLLTDISTALERRNILLLGKTLDELISYIRILPEAEYVSDFIEQANMSQLRIEHILKKTIFVIGDSHVNFFSGNEELSFVPVGRGINTSKQVADLPFSVFHMGPCLAYNSNRYNTTCMFREKLDYLLSDIIEKGSEILFVMGWVDIRAHVFKQCKRQNCQYEVIIDEILKHYVHMMKGVKQLGYIVDCFGPIGSLKEELSQNDEYPDSGSETERNQATVYFTKRLGEMCAIEGIGFISLLGELLTCDHKTRSEYLCSDGCHLGQIAMPLMIRELDKLCSMIMQGR